MTDPNESPEPANKQQLVNQINILEQNLQQVIERRRSLEQSLRELRSASEHVDDTDEPMRLIGNLLVAQPKQEIDAYIEDKQDEQEQTLESVKESEEKLRDQLDDMKEDFLDS